MKIIDLGKYIIILILIIYIYNNNSRLNKSKQNRKKDINISNYNNSHQLIKKKDNNNVIINWKVSNYPTITAKKGTIFKFEYIWLHDVWLVEEEDFNNNKKSSSSINLKDNTFTPDETGTYYILCSKGKHAKNGQKIKIEIRK